jgi:hypothetical protein
MGHPRSTPAPAYDADFFAWTQHQAKLLRTLPRWRADLPAEIDFEQVAEEIEDLGKAELHAVESYLRQILVHLIKAASEPRSRATGHWRTEAAIFQIDLLRRYTPAMRHRIGLQAIWKEARKIADLSLREHGSRLPADVPEECPFSHKELLAPDFDFDDAVGRVAAAQQRPS